MGNTTPSPAGSVNNQPASNGGAKIVTAQVNTANEFKVSLVVGSSPNNSGANILILPSMVPTFLGSKLGTALPDQTNVTLSSSISAGTSGGLGEYENYIKTAGLTISYMRLTATDTSLYNNNLWYGVMPFTGFTAPNFWPLSNIATPNSSGGYMQTCQINNMPDGVTPISMPLTRNTYMFFDKLPVSSTVTISFGVSGSSENVINS